MQMPAIDRENNPGDFHAKALTEPYVNVSMHTAPIIQPGKGHQAPNDVGFGEIGMDEISVIRSCKTPNMTALAKEGISL